MPALRVCDLCGGVDDAPREQLVLGPGEPAPTPTPALVAAVTANLTGVDPAVQAAVFADLHDTQFRIKHIGDCPSERVA